MQAAQKNIYKIGDQVRVEWHGTMYAARVTGIVGQERYRVHYEGYGSEWDETSPPPAHPASKWRKAGISVAPRRPPSRPAVLDQISRFR